MEAPGSKRVTFRCGLNGVISKEAPDLLKDGQYRSASNVTANQEGSVSSRTGPKQVGQLPSNLKICYFARKLVVQPGENPTVPSLNPRYLAAINAGSGNIYRTPDYNTGMGTPVATGVDPITGGVALKHWEMAPYSAGASGTPWAYFACPNAMLKDSGNSPFATLPLWGIPAAIGVVLASVVLGNDNVTSIIGSIVSGSTTIWNGVVITLQDPAGLSDFDQVTFAGTTGITVTTTDGRTDLVAGSPWDIRVGVPDISGNINNTSTQFRIFDTNGIAVVLASGTYSGTGASVTGVPVSGNLDGGAQSSPNNTQPYDWVTVCEETSTGDRGNPSQFMSSAGTASVTIGGTTYTCNPVAIHNGQVELIIWGTGDPRIGFIRVYRRGGTLTDGIGRLVARIPNPGNEAYTVITDNTSDPDLVYLEQWNTDLYPPVVSTVPAPITFTSSGAIATGWQTVGVSGFGPVAAAMGGTGAGALIHITDSAGTSEDVYAEVATSTTFRAYFQIAHAAGVSITVDAIYGQNCNLVAVIGDAVVVAGDPNNPHVLYKSATGMPQAFPIGTDAAGAITNVNVGTPSNGIVNLTECRGQIFCLNVSSCYEVALIQGSLYQPAEVAGKGLKGQSAWCKTESEEIWWVSDDGVYSWDGGNLRKRSEAIDPIFHGQQINGIVPMNMSATALAQVRMEYRRGVIHLVYTDTNSIPATHDIRCEPMYGDRWIPCVDRTVFPPNFVNMLYREPDTESLVMIASNGALSGNGAIVGIDDVTVVNAGVNLTSDWWSAGPSADGAPINWSLSLPWFDMGSPTTQKLFEEIWLDIDPQLYTGIYPQNSLITVQLVLNYSDSVIDLFSVVIPIGSSLVGRQLISLLPNLQNTSGSIYQSYGREARSISFVISGQAYPVQMQLFQIIMQYQDTGLLSAGSASDWMDLGSKHDKRLYQMTVIFDTAGVNRDLVLETRGGRDGLTAGTPQIFSLVSPTDLGSGRCMKVFPMADSTIGKLLRVRPYASATAVGQSTVDLWRILEVTFPDAEEYPPDIVTVAGTISNGKVTEAWTSGGYEYDKYANQIDFEVNTNGVPVTVQLQADSSNVGPPLVITATQNDRQRNITLPPGLIGKRWRIFVDPNQAAIAAGAGMFQLWNLAWQFQPADKGAVGHTFDWDDLGHPYDKLLQVITIEYDVSLGGSVTLQMDILIGILGSTIIPNVATFPLLGPNRGKVSFAIAPDTIVKMVRIYPNAAVPVGFKQWKYYFQKTDYPADSIEVTAWRDASSPDDKEPSWLSLDADTAGIAASVILQNENGTVMTVQHTGTVTNRMKNYPIPIDTRAKMWRILPTPGVNGKYQMFNWGFQRWSRFDPAGPDDPPETVLCTPWTTENYEYDKYANQIDFEVNTNGVPIVVRIQADGADTGETLTITSTFLDRQRNFTLPTGLIGKRWRIAIDSSQSGFSGGGRFQLWNVTWKFQPADKGEVGHTFDWDDLGHPYDKLLETITIEYDITSGGAVTLQMDTLTGIAGATDNPNVATFPLNGPGRGKVTLPLAPDTIVKMVRVYPQSPVPIGFKQWKYFFKFTPYPPDTVEVVPWRDATSPDDKEPSWLSLDADTQNVAASVILQDENGTVMTVSHTGTVTNRMKNYPVPIDTHAKMWRILPTPGVGGKFQLFNWIFQRWHQFTLAGPDDPPEVILCTPWTDFDYPYPKLARNLILTINTGGIAGTVQLETQEAGVVQSFPINTTFTSRRVVLACNPNLSGTLWRLVLVPGTGGLMQLWDWNLDVVKEPAAVTQWTSYGQSFGYDGFKLLKELWIDYNCAVGLNVTFASNQGQAGAGSVTFNLPAHPVRGVERVLFPTGWGAGLYKSVLYDVSLASADGTTTFQMWADASGIMWLPQGTDRHSAYQSTRLSEFMQIPI